MKRVRFVVVLIFCSINFCIEATSENYGLSESEGKCDHNCFSVVLETLQVAHSAHSAGQVLVSSDWFQKVDQISLTKYIHVPWVIYAQAKNVTSAIKTISQSGALASYRFTSARFAHLHHSTFASSTSTSASSSSSLFINAQRQQTWRKFLYLTIRRGIRISILDLLEQSASSSSSKGAGLFTAWHTLIQKDLFIVTFDLVQLLDSVASMQKLQLENHAMTGGDLKLPQRIPVRRSPANGISKNTIWIGCSPTAPHNGTYSSSVGNRQVCIYSLRKGFTALLGHISHCTSDTAVTMHIDKFHQLIGSPNAGVAGKNTTRFQIPLVKRRGTDSSSNDLEESETPTPSSGMAVGGMLTRRRLDPLSGRKGFLYSSLVFITKKLPDNTNNSNSTSSSVWGPFTVASWLGILAAYTLTAIVFGIIKLVTLNNLENSWYDWVIGQLLGFLISVEKVTGTGTTTRLNDTQQGNAGRERMCSVISSSTVIGGINIEDENANEIPLKDASKFLRVAGGQDENLSKIEIRRISVKSLAGDPTCPSSTAKGDNTQPTFVQVKCSQNRGKISRTILYGTIRLVSFIILGLYEGNLYTTITFPKSKLVATFDELISSDKYIIKVSSEAAKLENITARIQGNSSAAGFGNVETFLKSPPELQVTTNSSTSGSAGDGKFVESVNILDCVNWVEAGPDPNHACVGYEFELRNLHKAQKSDKIVVRSNKRLLRFSATGGSATSPGSSRFLSGRRRGFTMFPGGFQISKWILESGILQLWSVVENAFLESIVNPHWGDPFKVFTIRDYMGLFVVYAMLLILATIMFLLEHIVRLLKKIADCKKVCNFFKSMKSWSCKINEGKSCWTRMSCQDFCCIGNCSSCEVPSWIRMGSKFDKWRGKKYFQGWSTVNRTTV